MANNAFTLRDKILLILFGWRAVEIVASLCRFCERLSVKIIENAHAPNPRRVRIFLAEKNVEVEKEQIDLKGLEQHGEDFTKINPLQSVPVLVLDDGTTIAESVAICRYFEALYPEPNLFGTDAVSIALIDMWNRRIEFNLFAALRHAFRHLHPGMAQREVPQIAEWGEANKPKALAFLTVLNEQLKDNAFVAGERFSIADITTLVAIDFMKMPELELSGELTHVHAWYDTVSARPSARA